MLQKNSLQKPPILPKFNLPWLPPPHPGGRWGREGNFTDLLQWIWNWNVEHSRTISFLINLHPELLPSLTINCISVVPRVFLMFQPKIQRNCACRRSSHESPKPQLFERDAKLWSWKPPLEKYVKESRNSAQMSCLEYLMPWQLYGLKGRQRMGVKCSLKSQ